MLRDKGVVDMLTEDEKNQVNSFFVRIPTIHVDVVTPNDPDYETSMTAEELDEYLNEGGD